MQQQDRSLDTIAVWERKGDNLQLHLRRDGKVFYLYVNGEWEDASANGYCSMDSVEKWIDKGGGAGFERLERISEDS